jgi:hypothetical protein
MTLDFLCRLWRRPRFALRSLFLVTLAVALVTGWYASRYRQMLRAAQVLEQHGASFFAGAAPHPWYDRLPFLEPPPRIVNLSLGSGTDLASIVPEVRALGTVRRVSIYGLSTRDMQLLSQIDSIRSVEASYGLTTEQLRPLLSLPIEEFSVSGADVNISHADLELLLSIPTIKRIGMAHGEAGVPPKLRARHPNVAYFVTDFPP